MLDKVEVLIVAVDRAHARSRPLSALVRAALPVLGASRQAEVLRAVEVADVHTPVALGVAVLVQIAGIVRDPIVVIVRVLGDVYSIAVRVALSEVRSAIEDTVEVIVNLVGREREVIVITEEQVLGVEVAVTVVVVVLVIENAVIVIVSVLVVEVAVAVRIASLVIGADANAVAVEVQFTLSGSYLGGYLLHLVVLRSALATTVPLLTIVLVAEDALDKVSSVPAGVLPDALVGTFIDTFHLFVYIGPAILLVPALEAVLDTVQLLRCDVIVVAREPVLFVRDAVAVDVQVLLVGDTVAVDVLVDPVGDAVPVGIAGHVVVAAVDAVVVVIVVAGDVIIGFPHADTLCLVGFAARGLVVPGTVEHLAFLRTEASAPERTGP